MAMMQMHYVATKVEASAVEAKSTDGEGEDSGLIHIDLYGV